MISEPEDLSRGGYCDDQEVDDGEQEEEDLEEQAGTDGPEQPWAAVASGRRHCCRRRLSTESEGEVDAVEEEDGDHNWGLVQAGLPEAYSEAAAAAVAAAAAEEAGEGTVLGSACCSEVEHQPDLASGLTSVAQDRFDRGDGGCSWW